MTAAVLEFKPDLILELGRAMGNSTAAFTNAANLLGPSACRVLSLCLSYEWHSMPWFLVMRIAPLTSSGPIS
jgi:cephalosporin hydroxylase